MKKLFNSIDQNIQATSIIKGQETTEELQTVFNPANLDQSLGQVAFAEDSSIKRSIDVAYNFFPQWKIFELEKKIKMFYESLNWTLPVDKSHTIEKFF